MIIWLLLLLLSFEEIQFKEEEGDAKRRERSRCKEGGVVAFLRWRLVTWQRRYFRRPRRLSMASSRQPIPSIVSIWSFQPLPIVRQRCLFHVSKCSMAHFLKIRNVADSQIWLKSFGRILRRYFDGGNVAISVFLSRNSIADSWKYATSQRFCFYSSIWTEIVELTLEEILKIYGGNVAISVFKVAIKGQFLKMCNAATALLSRWNFT